MGLPATSTLKCPSCEQSMPSFGSKSFHYRGCSHCGAFSYFSATTPKIIKRYDYDISHFQGLLSLGQWLELEGKRRQVIARLFKKMWGEEVEWVEYLMLDEENEVATLAQSTFGRMFNWECTHSLLSNTPDEEQVARLDEKGYQLEAEYVVFVNKIEGMLEEDISLYSGLMQVREYENDAYVFVSEEFNGQVKWFEGYYLDNFDEEIDEGNHVTKYQSAPARPTKKLPSSFKAQEEIEHQERKGKYRSMIAVSILAALLSLLIFLIYFITQPTKTLYNEGFANDSIDVYPPPKQSRNYRTSDFKIDGPTGVSIQFNVELYGTWREFDGSLVNSTTGRTYTFSALAETYYGYDEGESWLEGEQSPIVNLSSVESGTYHLSFQWFSEGKTIYPFHVRVTQNESWISNLLIFLFAIFAYPLLYYLILISHYER